MHVTRLISAEPGATPHRRDIGRALLRAVAAVACAAMLGACIDTSRDAGTTGFARAATSPGSSSEPDLADGASARQVRAFAESSTPHSSVYRIGPQDVLDISVFQVSELARTVQVADSGTILLPLIGDVRAGGRTSQALEKELIARYAQYVRSPQVTVFIKEFNSQRITFDGAFKKPGVYPYKGNLTLLQAMALADNFDSNVADNSVLIFRTTNGERTAGRFDVDGIRSGQIADPALEPGDVIVASSSDTKITFNNVMKVVGPITGFARLFY